MEDALAESARGAHLRGPEVGPEVFRIHNELASASVRAQRAKVDAPPNTRDGKAEESGYRPQPVRETVRLKLARTSSLRLPSALGSLRSAS